MCSVFKMVLNGFIKFEVKNNPSDCLICAIRPSLNFNKLCIFNADYYCYHDKISASPQFRASKRFVFLSVTYCILLVTGVVEDIVKMGKEIEAEDLLTMIRISNSICIAYCQISYTMLTNAKLVEYNGLLSIINHRKSFGLKSMLNKSDTKKINDTMFQAVLFASSLQFMNILPLLALKTIDFDLLIDIITSELATFGFISILVVVMEDFEVFTFLFGKCLQQMKIHLTSYEEDISFEEKLYNRNVSMTEKLQTIQRLYMAVGKSFKFLEVIFPPNVMLSYIINTMILVLLETYIIVLYFRSRLELNIFHYQILWKSVLIIFGCSLCCIQMHRIRELVDDRLSSLFKIPISKLNRTEATQYEMLIKMIIEQKPELRVSEMYTWGPTIVLSIIATGITYMLVLLQFRLFW